MSDPIYSDIAKAYADAAKVVPGLKARFEVAGSNSVTVSSL